MSLYFTLLLLSVLVPAIFTFEQRLKFYQKWKNVFFSIFVVALGFVIVDIFYTKYGIWGFNSTYHSSIILFGLPIEEWLFFVLIPYASIFIHATFVFLLPSVFLPNNVTRFITILLIALSVLVIAFHFEKLYTIYSFGLLLFTLIISLFNKTGILNRFYITFLIILIPFCIVNSILTGSFIESPVVWYNNAENLNIRIFTIPIEDFGYGFSLILLNLLLMNRIEKS